MRSIPRKHRRATTKQRRERRRQNAREVVAKARIMGAVRLMYASPELILRESPFLQMLRQGPEDRPYSRGVLISCPSVRVEQDGVGNVVFTTRSISIPIRSGRSSRLSIPPEKFQSILARLEEDMKSRLNNYLLSQK